MTMMMMITRRRMQTTIIMIIIRLSLVGDSEPDCVVAAPLSTVIPDVDGTVSSVVGKTVQTHVSLLLITRILPFSF